MTPRNQFREELKGCIEEHEKRLTNNILISLQDALELFKKSPNKNYQVSTTIESRLWTGALKDKVESALRELGYSVRFESIDKNRIISIVISF